jgi:hypothetical protein
LVLQAAYNRSLQISNFGGPPRHVYLDEQTAIGDPAGLTVVGDALANELSPNRVDSHDVRGRTNTSDHTRQGIGDCSELILVASFI